MKNILILTVIVNTAFLAIGQPNTNQGFVSKEMKLNGDTFYIEAGAVANFPRINEKENEMLLKIEKSSSYNSLEYDQIVIDSTVRYCDSIPNFDCNNKYNFFSINLKNLRGHVPYNVKIMIQCRLKFFYFNISFNKSTQFAEFINFIKNEYFNSSYSSIFTDITKIYFLK